MTNFPNGFDDDTTLPPINDNITQEGGFAINALRSVVFAMEQYLGLGGAGSTGSIAARLGVSINPDGTINPSAIASLGLITLPITQDQIALNAQIPESKLLLDHRTQDLFNYIRDLSKDVNLVDGWISISGIKLEPHLIGAIYRHVMNQIDVTNDLVNYPFMNNKFRVPRDNLQSYNLVNDINNELLYHQWADGYAFNGITYPDVITANGHFYPSNYAHYAGSIFIDTSRFAVIPQTAADLQSLADFLDTSSILLLGSRIQNLYANGISRNSRSSSLLIDGYGQSIVPVTTVTTFLLGMGNSSTPVDNINNGDDIIQFFPANNSSNLFDEQFAQVRVGDIVRVNYGGVEVQFVILEKKYNQDFMGNKTFIVRIAGKNLQYTTTAQARIDRPLYNNNKYGVLSTSAVNGRTGISGYPASLIVGTARGAQTLGLDFSPDEFNETHFSLYLVIYPDGNPAHGQIVLPAIDVTGNAGTTPGAYTLDNIVAATNVAFRQPGFNYRFVAFEYQGNFGVMLADSYNGTSFSIISAIVNSSGNYDHTATQVSFPNNVVDVFPTVSAAAPDPLGLGPANANVASPQYLGSYSSANQAIIPTQVFVPLKRNNYYVDGVERERMSLDVGQLLDGYGDGYWIGQIQSAPVIIPGPGGRVSTTYVVNQDLSTSQLKVGKTLVVQSINEGGSFVDFGRFIISLVEFGACGPFTTSITVYDAVNGQGASPTTTAGVGTTVALYFNSDSVTFDNESATDYGNDPSPSGPPFKRHFEVYVDEVGATYTHERGRMSLQVGSGSPTSITVNSIPLYTSSPLSSFDIVRISPKLRGFTSGTVTKISLNMVSYDQPSGVYVGYLANYNGVSFSNQGPITAGKRGEITRFYDYSNVDYVDINLDIGNSLNTVTSFTNQVIDIQLFPTLSLDEQVMLISTCQLSDSTQIINQLIDQRQFGNISEEQLTTSALNYIALPDRLLHFNGVVRGFDIVDITNEFITLTGGMALVNGNLEMINQQIITVPKIKEFQASTYWPINFALCVNSSGEMILLPLTDFDAVLGTPNVPFRLVVMNNVVTGNTYNADAAPFSYILNSRKDLTVLYIVSSTVTGSGPGAVVNLLSPIPPRDVRRFINDSDSGIPAILTDGYNQGNFRSLPAALNWLKFNDFFQNILQIKGIFSVSGDPGLNFPLDIVGAGELAGMTFSSALVMSEVNFIGVGVDFASSLTATGVSFSNSIVTLNAATLINVAFIDSTVNINTLLVTSGIVSFTNCIINVPIQQAFTIASDLSFVNCVFNYTFNANPGGTPVAGYVPVDLINAGSGLMYVNLTGELNNFTVAGCTFNYLFFDHFPMISMQLGGTSPTFSYGAIAHNVTISENKFICLPVIDDPRAIVAFTSTATTPASGPTYPPFPKLVNLNVVNNICNYDQIILLSTVRATGQAITGAMIACVNCKITDNICGTIGYITASDSTSNDFNSAVGNIGAIRDKSDQLVIERNACKLITNIDSTGQYITFKSTDAVTVTDWVKVGTGDVRIVANSVNWILVGNAVWSIGSSYTSNNAGTTIITNNRVTPGNISILPIYKDYSFSGVVPPAIGILLRGAASSQVDHMSRVNIISENVISPKTLLQPNGVPDAYGYAVGIKCEASANIIGNNVSSVISGGLFPIVFLGGDSSGGPVINLTNNILNRNGLLVAAYVQAVSNNAVNQVKITDNSFDSMTVDGIANVNVGLNIPPTWTFHSNKNQTFFVELPLLDTNASYTATLGPGAGNTSAPAAPSYLYFSGDSGAFLVSKTIEIGTLVAGGIIASSQYVVFTDTTAATATDVRGFTMDIPLDRLPPNTRVLNAKLGLYAGGPNNGGAGQLDFGNPIGGTSTYNAVSVIMMQYNNILTSGPSAHGVLDVQTNYQASFLFGIDQSVANTAWGTYYINNVGQENNLKSTTQYITVDLSGQTWITNQNYRIAAEINVSYKRTSGGVTAGAFILILSPLVLTCVYE